MVELLLKTSADDHKLDIVPWKLLKPAPEIVLTLNEILELAGVPNALDEPNVLSGQNGKPGVQGSMLAGPIARITGLEIILQAGAVLSGQHASSSGRSLGTPVIPHAHSST